MNLICKLFGHRPSYKTLIDNQLNDVDTTYCERCYSTIRKQLEFTIINRLK